MGRGGGVYVDPLNYHRGGKVRMPHHLFTFFFHGDGWSVLTSYCINLVAVFVICSKKATR